MTFSTQKILSSKQAIIQLHEMLTYMRPGGTKTEEAFVAKFVDDLPGVWSDGYGNRHLIIGDTNVLWSCHTDSVHRDEGRQVVLKRAGHFMLKDKQHNDPSCLGADCATGVWIMRNMIQRGVPGHYVFHRDEESGGIGSGWIAKNDAGLLDGVQIAVAFDRKGYDSVITCQGGRTASDAFAQSMAALLGDGYKPDPTGLFTDTAKYSSIIPECSNISVGYSGAHSSQEQQDYEFAAELLDKMTELDITKLVVARDPKVIEYSNWGGRSYRWTDHYADSWGSDDWGFDTPATTSTGATKRRAVHLVEDYDRPRGSTNYARLKHLIENYHEEVADWLDNEGVDADELADSILAHWVK